MITHVELSTFENQYFKLDLQRNERDTSGTYELVRYRLPDDTDVWRSVANSWIQVYMTEYDHMTPNLYMGGVDLEFVNTEKDVLDVSNVLRFYDSIIDNRPVDPYKVYAYTFVCEEFGKKYRTPYVTGYVELDIDEYAPSLRPTTTVDWLKHRGVPDVEILNTHYENIFGDILFCERKILALEEKHNRFIDKIKVNELLDKLEQVLELYEMLKLYRPTKEVRQRLGWGVSEFGKDSWGFAELVLELGFPYTFT